MPVKDESASISGAGSRSAVGTGFSAPARAGPRAVRSSSLHESCPGFTGAGAGVGASNTASAGIP